MLMLIINNIDYDIYFFRIQLQRKITFPFVWNIFFYTINNLYVRWNNILYTYTIKQS